MHDESSMQPQKEDLETKPILPPTSAKSIIFCNESTVISGCSLVDLTWQPYKIFLNLRPSVLVFFHTTKFEGDSKGSQFCCTILKGGPMYASHLQRFYFSCNIGISSLVWIICSIKFCTGVDHLQLHFFGDFKR